MVCSEMTKHLLESQMETAHDVVLGREFKSMGEMAIQKYVSKWNFCQSFCSSLKISCFRIGYLDMRIHLWQTERNLEKIIIYVIIISSTCKYTTYL